MLDQGHQTEEKQDYLVMGLIISGYGLKKKNGEGKILAVFGLVAHHLQNLEL